MEELEGFKQTLCWDCQHARGDGCAKFAFCKPVNGWTIEKGRVDINVISCPEFIHDETNPIREKYKMLDKLIAAGVLDVKTFDQIPSPKKAQYVPIRVKIGGRWKEFGGCQQAARYLIENGLIDQTNVEKARAAISAHKNKGGDYFTCYGFKMFVVRDNKKK